MAMWMGDEETRGQLSKADQVRLEVAEAKAWLTVLVLAIVFALGLIIGSQNAPH